MKCDGGLKIEEEQAYPDVYLVEEFVSGQTSAFDRLYERYSSFVYNICLGMLGNPDDAKDAMQETFVQLYRSLPQFRKESTFPTWLYRMTVNKCLDALRRRSGHNICSLDWIGEKHLPVKDERMERQVREAVLKLSPDYRAVIVLHYFQELSYTEIAESLGCSVDQVGVRLHRARKAFRKAFGNGGDDVEV